MIEIYKLIFDIGSNVLNFTEACLRKHEGCKVISVDAIDLNQFSLGGGLERIKRMNNEYSGEVFYVNALVSDVDGQLKTFNINKNEPSISTVSEEWLNNSRFALGNKYILSDHKNRSTFIVNGTRVPGSSLMIDHFEKIIVEQFGSVKEYMRKCNNSFYEKKDVKTITLNSLVETHGIPDLIKIDVEGHEKKVISGLDKKANKICFEWTEEMLSDLVESFEYLRTIGYNNFAVLGFFEDKEKLKYLCFDENGDEFLKEPQEYFSFEEITNELKEQCNPERRVNWGMAWVK